MQVSPAAVDIAMVQDRPSSATSSYQKRPRIDHNELAEMEDRFYTLTMFYNQLQHQEVIVEAELNTI